uniref:Protein sleepless n=1 Tax=Caenorhabditis japonica TaxID=281687 RepID=A0A8R1HL36_CAEJA
MRLLLTSIIFFVYTDFFVVSFQHLQCYHCINRISTGDITKQEQNALKSALFARFNIPPSNEYCADGGDGVLFKTVPKELCMGVNDTCVRIYLHGDATKKLVLRGCQSTLHKSTFDLVTNYSCGQTSISSSECITTCQEPLCNTSHARNYLIPLTILLGTLGVVK